MQSRTWLARRFSRVADRTLPFLVLALLCPLGLSTASEKAAPATVVDSGAFGVFVGGRRVATETFSIRQDANGSFIKSEFKTESGTEKAVQSSDLQLTAAGELKSYQWKESTPGQAEATVVPSQDFLTERFTKTPEAKPQEQPFLLPAATSILDDYFYVHREVLAWKYLATSCKHENGQIECPLKQAAQIGTLNAHARQSMPVSVQYFGREKLAIRGVQRELIRLDIKTEVGDWTMWLDDQLKLQRFLDPTTNTEVVRD